MRLEHARARLGVRGDDAAVGYGIRIGEHTGCATTLGPTLRPAAPAAPRRWGWFRRRRVRTRTCRGGSRSSTRDRLRRWRWRLGRSSTGGNHEKRDAGTTREGSHSHEGEWSVEPARARRSERPRPADDFVLATASRRRSQPWRLACWPTDRTNSANRVACGGNSTVCSTCRDTHCSFGSSPLGCRAS